MRDFNVCFESYQGKTRMEKARCLTFAEAASFAYGVKNKNKETLKYIVSIVEVKNR